MMKRYLLKFSFKISLMLVLLANVINTSTAQTYKVRMATVGNSITYGALLDSPAEDCYPSQLNQLLSEIYGDTVEIKNFSVSGRTMMRSAENPIWNESEFPSALKYVPDICLIFLGTNDSKPYRWDAWGEEFKGDYLAMIDTFKFRNPHTNFILCLPTPIWEGHPYGTNFSDLHNDSLLVNYTIPTIDTVAKQTGAILMDFHTPFEDSLHYFPDKLHPNKAGAKKIAQMLFNKMIETDLIHQVEPGLAFISSFQQASSFVPEGGKTDLKWTTIFADSVFLDGKQVDINGSAEVIAESDKVYTLTAKGNNNTSTFPLTIETYIPEKKRINITSSSSDYQNGKDVTFYVTYKDQHNKTLTSYNNDVIWELTEGEGEFTAQTDTSVTFTPGAIKKIIIKATDGSISRSKTIYINTEPYLAIEEIQEGAIIYPNPVSDILFISETVTDISSLAIKTLKGKTLEMIKVRPSNKVKVAHLPAGVYVVEIKNKNNLFTQKIVKQ